MQNPWPDAHVLAHLGCGDARLLGEGGEARVFAIEGDRALRLMRPGAQADLQRARATLLRAIAAGNTSSRFRTPTVIEIVEIGGRVAVIEERLAGITLADALKTAGTGSRHSLISSYLDAAAAIGDIAIGLPFWGDILAPPGIRAESYRDYLADKLLCVRAASGPLAQYVMTDAPTMPDCHRPSLVHFDIFPSNVLVEADGVSAIIDFGASSKMADRRLDVWSAVAYLDPEISPSATDADRNTALDWLKDKGLSDDYPLARRWIASSWCFAHDDPAVWSWCRRVLSA